MKVKSDNTIYIKYWYNHGESFDASKIQIELGNPEFQWGKPDLGFWGSLWNASFGWKEWCIAENYGDYDWNNPIYFRLKSNSTILKIYREDLNDDVLSKYVILDEKMYHAIHREHYFLDYNKIVDDGIDAVELMDGSIGHSIWYNKYEQIFNSWDCESIVVLNKDVLEFI